MASLTKIFTGMESGPEKIDGNMQALNAELIAATTMTQKHETMIKLPSSSFIKSGEVTFTRVGPLVIMSAAISFSAAAQWQTLIPTANIPNGYGWSDVGFASGVLFSNSVGGANAFLYSNGSGLQVITNSATSSPQDVQGFLAWPTNDDMPD